MFHGHSHKEILNLLNNIQLQVRQNTLLLKQLLQKQKMAEVLVTSSNDLSLPLTTEHSLEEYEKSLEDDNKMKLLVCMIMCMTIITARQLFL